MEVFFPASLNSRAPGASFCDPALKAHLRLEEPPFLQLITLDLSFWLAVRQGAVLEDDDGYRQCYRSKWNNVSRANDPPAPMAPFLVAAFDIEVASSHGTLVPVRRIREDGARDRHLAGEQLGSARRRPSSMRRGVPGGVRAVGPGRDAQQVHPKSGSGGLSHQDVYRRYIENDAHNIISSNLSNTEKIERLGELLN
jgi:hypothetical protein